MQPFVTFVAVCLIAFASAQSEDLTARRNSVLEKCKHELAVNDEIAAIAHTKKEATTEPERCLMECLYKNLGLIKDGKLSLEGADSLAKARFGEKTELLQKAKEIFEKCQQSYVPANEKCSLGKHVRGCFLSNDSEQLNFFPKQ